MPRRSDEATRARCLTVQVLESGLYCNGFLVLQNIFCGTLGDLVGGHAGPGPAVPGHWLPALCGQQADDLRHVPTGFPPYKRQMWYVVLSRGRGRCGGVGVGAASQKRSHSFPTK